jgi:hypothetical protein
MYYRMRRAGYMLLYGGVHLKGGIFCVKLIVNNKSRRAVFRFMRQ